MSFNGTQRIANGKVAQSKTKGKAFLAELDTLVNAGAKSPLKKKKK